MSKRKLKDSVVIIEEIEASLEEISQRMLLASDCDLERAALAFCKRHKLQQSSNTVISALKNIPANLKEKMWMDSKQSKRLTPSKDTIAAVDSFLRKTNKVKANAKNNRRIAAIIEDETDTDWDALIPKKGSKQLGISLPKKPKKYDENVVAYFENRIRQISGRTFFSSHYHNPGVNVSQAETGEPFGDIDLLKAILQWFYNTATFFGGFQPTTAGRTVNKEGILSLRKRSPTKNRGHKTSAKPKL